MKTVAFEDQEVKVLAELLKGDQARMLLEIAHTDTREYKAYLKERETTLERIMSKVC